MVLFLIQNRYMYILPLPPPHHPFAATTTCFIPKLSMPPDKNNKQQKRGREMTSMTNMLFLSILPIVAIFQEPPPPRPQ